MAGHRKGTGKPLRRISSFERRRARLNAELAATTDLRDRVVIAADFVRTLLAQHPNEEEADQVVRDLIAAGERIYEQGRRAA